MFFNTRSHQKSKKFGFFCEWFVAWWCRISAKFSRFSRIFSAIKQQTADIVTAVSAPHRRRDRRSASVSALASGRLSASVPRRFSAPASRLPSASVSRKRPSASVPQRSSISQQLSASQPQRFVQKQKSFHRQNKQPGALPIIRKPYGSIENFMISDRLFDRLTGEKTKENVFNVYICWFCNNCDSSLKQKQLNYKRINVRGQSTRPITNDRVVDGVIDGVIGGVKNWIFHLKRVGQQSSVRFDEYYLFKKYRRHK